MEYYGTLNRLLWFGIGEGRLRDDRELSEEETQKFYEGGKRWLGMVISGESPPGGEEAVNFMAYELFLASRYVLLSEGNAGAIEVFKKKNELLDATYEITMRQAASNGEAEIMRVLFEGWNNSNQKERAQEMLIAPGMDEEDRLRMTVEYINVFGFIDAIDFLAKSSKDEELEAGIREGAAGVYKKLEGDEVNEIAVSLSDVYGMIDFGQYRLNSMEATTQEVGEIERVVGEMEGDPRGKIIVDAGGGTGRHSLELKKRGYEGIRVLELEAKHAEAIKEQDPEMQVIQGDWGEMHRWIESADVIYSLGRTLPHNRTPAEMLNFFDEGQRILTEKGRIYFDMLGINWGVFKERVEQLREHLEGLGVKPIQSRNVFDGPEADLKFNRMTMDENQVRIMSKLLGYKVLEVKDKAVGEGERMAASTYLLEKDEDFDPQRITSDDLMEGLRELGLLDPGTDFSLYVEAWGMTIGQALVFVYTMGLGNDYIRELNEKGSGPKISIETRGTKIYIEGGHINMEDWEKALKARTTALPR